MHICIDIGHTGRAGKPPARYGTDLDEVGLSWQFLGLMAQVLDYGQQPSRVTVLSYGTYADRHAWANQHGCTLYLNLHWNVIDPGQVPYGLILDRGDEASRRYGESLARQLGTSDFYALRRDQGGNPIIVDEVGPAGYRVKNPWPPGAFTLLDGLRCPGLVLELLGPNHPKHNVLEAYSDFVGLAELTALWINAL